MPATSRNTIFALSSGRPPAAIAVVRISGPQAGGGLQALIGRLPEPRRASLAYVRDPQTRELIDEALALWFPGPRTETGEDMAELHLHGGRAVIAAALRALGGVSGLRPAEAGEFTRRAFENGRIDLTRVEGLADLIWAETEAQRRQAVQHLQGLLGKQAETWRARLVEALALVEAAIDFSDEGDVPSDLVPRALAGAKQLAQEIGQAAAGRGERLRDGLVVAISGPPNVGKSTLFNALAKREAAIVSPIPGTTRDVLEIHLDLGGYPITVLDSAGLRETDDPVEREGVRRAREAVGRANLVLRMLDATTVAPVTLWEVAQQEVWPAGTEVWTVLNKIDLLDAAGRTRIEQINQRTFRDFRIAPARCLAAAAGEGIEQLERDIGAYAARFFGGEPALVTRERHRVALIEAGSALAGAAAQGSQAPEELIAEHLRQAARALDRLLGRVDVEHVLDVIFRDFCIGK